MNYKKCFLFLFILISVISFFYFDLGRFFTFNYLKTSQDLYMDYYKENPFIVVSLFFLIYVILTAFSFPGAAVMTIAAGLLFGLIWGTIIVSFASTIGATIAMLFSRYLLRDWVEKNFSKSIKKINFGIEKEGSFYLFSLRLMPVIPFFVINLAMGLTKIRIWTYFWVSQIGMFFGTIVYVNAGSQLANVNSFSEILSLKLLLSFIILGFFPLVAKKGLDYYNNKFRKYENNSGS